MHDQSLDSMSFRPLKLPDDLPALFALDTSFTTERIYHVEQHALCTCLVATPVTPSLTKSFPLADELHDPAAEWDYAVVGEVAGVIVGFAAVQVQHWNRRAILRHLYVAPTQRGRGIGHILLNAALQFASAHASRCLWLEATNFNYPAIQFYQRAGFAWCGYDAALYDPDGPAAGEIALFFMRHLDDEDKNMERRQ